MSVNKVTDTARQRIIKKSVDPLPNNPGKAGFRADEVKKAMFGFVTDEEDSLLKELNRVVDEINESFLEEDEKFKEHYTKKETYSAEEIDDKIANVKVDLSDYDTRETTVKLLEGKVDKIEGMGLSSNNFTDGLKNKLEGLENYDDTLINSSLNNFKDLTNQSFESVNSQLSRIEEDKASKDFVNSSIETATATFKGTFTNLDTLKATQADNNDYAFYDHYVADNRTFDRYKYNGTEWVYEYSLNNSSFTDAQWKAINSGITEELKNQILTNVASINNLLNTVSELNINKANQTSLDETNKTVSTMKTKLDGIEAGAEVNTVDSVNGKTGDVKLNAEDVGALPSDTQLFSGSYNDLSNKPTLFSGNYNDLSNKPTIPTSYIKDASVTDDVLTIEKQDGTKLQFEGGGNAVIIRRWIE